MQGHDAQRADAQRHMQLPNVFKELDGQRLGVSVESLAIASRRQGFAWQAFFCSKYDSPFQSIGGWSDDSDDQSLEESPHAANAHPESPDTHSPRSSVSSPWTIYPESQDGFEGAYSLDGGESEEEQHEEVPELA